MNPITPQIMMQALTAPGAMGAPMAPIQRPTVPGLIPPRGQGSPSPALTAQQILTLLAQPKLQGKVR